MNIIEQQNKLGDVDVEIKLDERRTFRGSFNVRHVCEYQMVYVTAWDGVALRGHHVGYVRRQNHSHTIPDDVANVLRKRFFG